MDFICSVSAKGQVTIPKKLRDLFNIKAKDKVLVELYGDHLRIYPASSEEFKQAVFS